MPKTLCVSGIWINTIAHFAKANAIDHSLRHLTHHITCGASYKSAAKYFICAFLAVDLVNPSLRLTESAVATVEKLGVGIILNALGLQIGFVETNAGDLGVGVGACWEDDGTLRALTLEKGVADDIASMNV